MDSIKTRFSGIDRIYGQQASTFLAQQQVIVIGLGGVGSWAAEALVRSGIGAITLVDLDDICITNTNRQLHTTEQTIGQSKVQVMMARLQSISPQCQIHGIEDFLDIDNLTTYLSQNYHYVVDAIDSVVVKAALIHHCKRHKIKVITTGAAGGKTDPTQIQIADLSRSIQDPLLAKVRYKLRQDHHFSRNPKRRFAIDCVFSPQQLVYPQADGSVCQQKQGVQQGTALDCATGLGATMMVTASFGLAAAARVVEKLLSTQPD